MKAVSKLLTLAALLICFQLPAPAQPFAGKTKHKTVNRMKPHQVRKIQNGENYYVRKKGKIKKNF